MPASPRSPLLTVAAVCFALLAISNMLKPVRFSSEQPGYIFFPELMEFVQVQVAPLGNDGTGFVFFGKRLSGVPNAIVGPLFGLYLLAYAIGIWGLRRWAVPVGIAYAAYVLANVVLFSIRTPPPAGAGVGYRLFGLVYAFVGIGISAGTVWLLTRRRP